MAVDDHQAYRAMDLLVEADAPAEEQEAVFPAAADVLNLEVDLLFFDTTSTSSKRDTEKPGPAADRRPRDGAGDGNSTTDVNPACRQRAVTTDGAGYVVPVGRR